MKYNVYILFIIILCSTFFTQANVIYSGTRFIYNEDDNDIIINISFGCIKNNQGWLRIFHCIYNIITFVNL